MAEQSPKNAHQKSGKSAYFLARAKAKSYNICDDDGTKNNNKEGIYWNCKLRKHCSNLSFWDLIILINYCICLINQAKCVVDGSNCGPTSNFLEVPGEVRTSSNAKNYFFDSIQHRRRNLNKHRYTVLKIL